MQVHRRHRQVHEAGSPGSSGCVSWACFRQVGRQRASESLQVMVFCMQHVTGIRFHAGTCGMGREQGVNRQAGSQVRSGCPPPNDDHGHHQGSTGLLVTRAFMCCPDLGGSTAIAIAFISIHMARSLLATGG